MEVIITSLELAARIKDRRDGMTRSERLLGDHLLRHMLDAAFLPAARLGELVEVSESSVLRFAKTLGYGSYNELQQELQQSVREKLTLNAPERLQRAVSRDTSASAPAAAAMQTDIHNIRVTNQQLQPADLEAVVELLSQSRRVITVGMRGAAPLAQLLAYSLNLLRPGVSSLLHHSEMLADELIGVDERDVLIGFAYARQSQRTVTALDLARNAGAKVVAVTDDPLSPIAMRANHTFLVATESEAFIQSYTAACSIIHLLVASVGRKLQKSAMERLREIELTLEQSSVFFRE